MTIMLLIGLAGVCACVWRGRAGGEGGHDHRAAHRPGRSVRVGGGGGAMIIVQLVGLAGVCVWGEGGRGGGGEGGALEVGRGAHDHHAAHRLSATQ